MTAVGRLNGDVVRHLNEDLTAYFYVLIINHPKSFLTKQLFMIYCSANLVEEDSNAWNGWLLEVTLWTELPETSASTAH